MSLKRDQKKEAKNHFKRKKLPPEFAFAKFHPLEMQSNQN